MVFPNPREKRKICNQNKILVFTECYCSKGHNLISENAKFNGFNGILLQISNEKEKGHIALSSVYGCKTRVSVGIKLKEGNQYKLSCPECNTELPAFAKCHCGADIITLFLDREVTFNSFVGVCNRIGCENSYIQIGEELITSARMDLI